MVLSAYETTANALAFTMYLLSKPENAGKLAKLTAEIDVFGRERVPSFEELDKFPWLEVPPPASFFLVLTPNLQLYSILPSPGAQPNAFIPFCSCIVSCRCLVLKP